MECFRCPECGHAVEVPPEDCREAYKQLCDKIKTVVPYVLATINRNNCFSVKEKSEWIEVHAGRAASSHRQLEHLLKLAEGGKS